jgi:hypothetical protein
MGTCIHLKNRVSRYHSLNGAKPESHTMGNKKNNFCMKKLFVMLVAVVGLIVCGSLCAFTYSVKNASNVSCSGTCTVCHGTKRETCPTCYGNKGKWVNCTACLNSEVGRGKQKSYRNGQWVVEPCGWCKGQKEVWEHCRTCGGEGRLLCRTCKGTGQN